MFLEKTDYYNSNAPRANGVSFARVQQEIIWEDSLLAQQINERQMQFSAQFGNMECAINS
jgi:hypothetical protein